MIQADAEGRLCVQDRYLFGCYVHMTQSWAVISARNTVTQQGAPKRASTLLSSCFFP